MWEQIRSTLDNFINKQIGIIQMTDDIEKNTDDFGEALKIAQKMANEFTDKLEKEADTLKSGPDKAVLLSAVSGLIMANSVCSILINIPAEFRASAVGHLMTTFLQNLSRHIKEMEEAEQKMKEEEENKNVH